MYRVEERHGLVCAWRVADVPYMPNFIHVSPEWTRALPDIVKRPDLQEKMASSEAVTEIRLLAPDAETTRALENELAEAGFHRSASMPVMIRHGEASEPLRHGDEALRLDIRKAENREDFDRAFRLIHQVFGGPLVMNRFFVPDDGSVIPYYAMLDGEPVSAAVVWPYANVYGIYSVSTLETHRKRGFATRLLQHMLRDQGDFPFASLRTTDDLVPLYGKLGFREVGRCLCMQNRKAQGEDA